MCAIFGLIDYNHTLNAKQREKLLSACRKSHLSLKSERWLFEYKAVSNLKAEKLDKKCEKKQYNRVCSTYFLRFMAANLNLTQLVTRV